MKKFFQSKIASIASTHQFGDLYNVTVPIPALQRGWLHGRQLTQPWDVDRILARISENCWFSYHCRDSRETDPDSLSLAPCAIAGFWPDGGFLELIMSYGNQLHEHPQGLLALYTDSPARTEKLLSALIADYRLPVGSGVRQPRVGMLNFSYGNLTVERIRSRWTRPCHANVSIFIIGRA